MSLDEASSRCEKTPNEESKQPVKPPPGLSPTLSIQEQHTEKQQLQFLVRVNWSLTDMSMVC